ncbi:MAG: hypothetical protein NTX66_04065 [Candidatus Falkowbacteria bacterium]|nr:hypothetical protein [Candidatus Falkowbacteria bacterium]
MKFERIQLKLSDEDKVKALKKAQREAELASPGISRVEKVQPSSKEYKRRGKHKGEWLEDIE